MTSAELLTASRHQLRATLGELAQLVGQPAPTVADADLEALLIPLATRAMAEDPVGADRILRGRIVAMPLHGANLFVDLGEWTSWVLVRFHGWEVAVAQACARLLRAGQTAIDVGAHIGAHTLALAAAVGPTGRVVACEPDPANLALLTRTVEANDLGGVVAIRPLAVGATAGRAVLRSYVPDGARRFPGASSMLRSLVPMSDYTPAGLDVEVRPLDQLVAEAGGHAALIKIDVEGAELQVLAGGRGWLDAGGPGAVVVEVHPPELAAQGASVADVLGVLRGAGFKLHHLVPDGPRFVLRALIGDALHGDHVIAVRS